jgi:hypothetical protein
MTSKGKILTVLFILLSQFSFGQTVNALKLKGKKYFTEKNHFYTDSVITFAQNIRFDQPLVFDEAYSQIFSFTILDSTNAKEKKELNLITDLSIIKSWFAIKSAWPSDPRIKYSISGLLKIVSWTYTKIQIAFDVSILNLKSNRIYNYKGNRSFIKSEDLNKLFSPVN